MSVLPEHADETFTTLGPDRVLSGLVESPLFPGVVAVAKMAVSLALLSAAVEPVLFAIAFLVAVTVYTHNRLTDVAEDAVNRPAQASLAATRRRALAGLAGGAYLIALALAVTGGPLAVGVVVIPALAGVVYSEAWLPVTGYDRLKEVPGVSTAVTAGAWAVPLAYLPVAFGAATGGEAAAFVAAFLFLRTAAASEVMNARDVAGDRAAGVATVPVVLGLRRTRHLLYAIDGLSVAVLLAGATWGHLPVSVAAAALPALGCSLVLTRGVGRLDGDLVATARDAGYLLLAACAVVGAGRVGDFVSILGP